uniref:Uncharacterized protein n=1 Tax=Chromera velia CCMP2878 TaxID=1169474 RepID=A0A0G4F1I0_9ALVE|eukprot:Cvel_14552.t1-p1 / transcript=Cvel_14552.t1 / gene=Cvel_14552 / organism=Chromera_velia_CCMP2878 / gene_product=POTE ankyrin domain family member D, putative / transcript_product=POTE ankyrin domain family member D, putative / location=Cvel_scaffold1040:19622-27433(-) / protein_length=720 / sequence_SO=supercontig / SO=protein_coding / is_pseudo=false
MDRKLFNSSLSSSGESKREGGQGGNMNDSFSSSSSSLSLSGVSLGLGGKGRGSDEVDDGSFLDVDLEESFKKIAKEEGWEELRESMFVKKDEKGEIIAIILMPSRACVTSRLLAGKRTSIFEALLGHDEEEAEKGRDGRKGRAEEDENGGRRFERQGGTRANSRERNGNENSQRRKSSSASSCPSKDHAEMRTRLFQAVDEENVKEVKALLAKGAAGSGGLGVNSHGQTVVLLVSRKRDPAILKALLEAGHDSMEPDPCGWTALHYASRFHVTIVKHLIKGTPLHTALMPRTSASTGCSPVIEIVKCLLEAGVDASKVDRFGRTALHVAVSGGLSGSCVEILKVLARSVDVNAVDKKGRRAADLAVHSPHILKELDRSQSSSLPVTAARFHRRLCEVCRPPPSSSEGGSLPPKEYESEGLWGLPHAGTGSAWKEMLELLDSTSSLNMSPSTESLIRSSCAAAASSSRSLDSSLSDLIKEGRRAQNPQSLVARLKRVVVIEIGSSTPFADIFPLLSSLTLEDLCKKATNLGNGWVKQRSAKIKVISDATESSWARATAAFSEMRTGNCWSFQDACARLERAETAKATLLGKMRGLEDSYSECSGKEILKLVVDTCREVLRRLEEVSLVFARLDGELRQLERDAADVRIERALARVLIENSPESLSDKLLEPLEAMLKEDEGHREEEEVLELEVKLAKRRKREGEANSFGRVAVFFGAFVWT